MKIGTYELNQIVTGDARILLKNIPDVSIGCVFTDPVYQNVNDYSWLAEESRRILRDGGNFLVYCGQYNMNEIIASVNQYLDWRWLLVEKKVSQGILIWSYRLFCHYVPVLWFTKGKPDGEVSRIDFQWGLPAGAEVNHPWSKGRGRARYWIEKFTQYNDVVLDPFCGGGAILSACKQAGRNFIGIEIDTDTSERARERVANTQTPLFVLEPQQLSIDFDGK